MTALKFPKYIPEVIKSQVNHYLYGSKRNADGWLNALQETKRKIDGYKKKCKSDEARRKLSELNNDYDSLLNDTECIKRLVLDERMEVGYTLLKTEFNGDDEKLDTFFQLIWSTNIDYKNLKGEKDEAKQILNDIAKTAEKLVYLINKAEKNSMVFPSEIFCIHSLLESTHNPKDPLWNGLKDSILLSDNKKTNGMISYTWRCAPDVRQMIKGIIGSIDRSKNVLSNDTGFDSGISKRQFNVKMSYLRALITKLSDYDIQTNTPEIKEAIGIITTVVLNEADIIIDFQDVQNALKSIE